MTSASLADVLRVGPSVRDILTLPPRSKLLYASGAMVFGCTFHIAVMQGAHALHRRFVKQRNDRTRRDNSATLQQLIPSLMHAFLTKVGAYGVEWAYANTRALPRAISGVVWCLRRLVGLPGEAPYAELSGGTPLDNVLLPAFEMERILNLGIPISSVGVMGIGAKPLSSEEIVEIFDAPSSSSGATTNIRPPSPHHFLTPTRVIRTALQLYAGALLVNLFRRFIVPKIYGVPNNLPGQSTLVFQLTIPLTFIATLGVLRDAETISVFGSTRFSIGMVGVASLLYLPIFYLSLMISQQIQPDNYPEVSDEQFNEIKHSFVKRVFPELPVQHMTEAEIMEVAAISESILVVSSRLDITSYFAGALATTSLLINCKQREGSTTDITLSLYGDSLERINAELEDTVVMERQESLVSVGSGDVDGKYETCPICLRAERPVSQDMLRVKGCGHEFHTECLSAWMRQSSECPLCRSHIQREMPRYARMQIQAWKNLSDEEKYELVGVMCVRASDAVYDCLSLSDKKEFNRQTATQEEEEGENAQRTLALNMLTINEFTELPNAVPNVPSLAHPEAFVLFSLMGHTWNADSFTETALINMFEDYICSLIAPVTMENLFPGTIATACKFTGLPPGPAGGPLQRISQRLVELAHLSL